MNVKWHLSVYLASQARMPELRLQEQHRHPILVAGFGFFAR
jgi:hypothetical protein